MSLMTMAMAMGMRTTSTRRGAAAAASRAAEGACGASITARRARVGGARRPRRRWNAAAGVRAAAGTVKVGDKVRA